MKKSISQTQEYNLAPKEKQDWAFLHPGNYISVVDAAKKSGIKTDITASVKANNGEIYEVKLAPHLYDIAPDSKYKMKWDTVNGKWGKIYFIKGSKVDQKNAVYFSHSDLVNAPEVQQLLKDLKDAHNKHTEEHHEMLKAELLKSHSTAAKKAAKELVNIAKSDGAQGVFDWFKDNKFSMPSGTNATHFKGLVNSIKDHGVIPSIWTISSKPDGYSHKTGTGGVINWQNKVISFEGWSSDD